MIEEGILFGQQAHKSLRHLTNPPRTSQSRWLTANIDRRSRVPGTIQTFYMWAISQRDCEVFGGICKFYSRRNVVVAKSSVHTTRTSIGVFLVVYVFSIFFFIGCPTGAGVIIRKFSIRKWSGP
jgi:hypothetical protein